MDVSACALPKTLLVGLPEAALKERAAEVGVVRAVCRGGRIVTGGKDAASERGAVDGDGRGEATVGIVVSSESAGEAAVVEEIDVIAVESLNQAVAFFAGHLEIEPTPSRLQNLFEGYEDDFADVRGQEMAKRALTIAAAGARNILTLCPFTPPTDCARMFAVFG